MVLHAQRGAAQASTSLPSGLPIGNGHSIGPHMMRTDSYHFHSLKWPLQGKCSLARFLVITFPLRNCETTTDNSPTELMHAATGDPRDLAAGCAQSSSMGYRAVAAMKSTFSSRSKSPGQPLRCWSRSAHVDKHPCQAGQPGLTMFAKHAKWKSEYGSDTSNICFGLCFVGLTSLCVAVYLQQCF